MPDIDTSRPQSCGCGEASYADCACNPKPLPWGSGQAAFPRGVQATPVEKEAATVKPDLTVGAIDRPDAIALWKAHGGDTYGPRVEHVRMPFSKFAGFVDAMLAPLRASLAAAEKERDAALSALSARYDPSDGDWSQASAEVARSILLTLGQHQSPSMEPGSDSRRDRVAKIIEEALAAAVARAEKAKAERDALAGPLTYGPYSCVPEHAVQCAYLLSLAEDDDDEGDAMTVVSLYVAGDVSMDEAIAALAAPAKPEDPAHD